MFRRTSTPNLAKATIRIFATSQNKSLSVDEAKQLNVALGDYQSSKELSQMYFPALCVNTKTYCSNMVPNALAISGKIIC